MSEATSQILLRAFELIEADKQDEARSVLAPVLESDSDNADALWLYSHAVETSEEALDTLTHLMNVDPGYPGASEMLAKIRAQSGMTSDEDGFFDEFEMPETSERGRFGRFLRILAVFTVVILIIVVVFILMSGNSNAPAAEPTAVAGNVQSVATNTPAATNMALDETEVPTEEPTDEAPVGVEETASIDTEGLILAAFSDVTLPDGAIDTISDPAFGKTLLLSVCVTASPLELIDNSMTTLASFGTQLTMVDALGVRVMDCETGETINTIAVDIDTAREFGQGMIELAQYQAQWRALD